MRIKDEPSIRLEYLLRTNQTLLTLVYYQGELKTRMIKKNAKKARRSISLWGIDIMSTSALFADDEITLINDRLKNISSANRLVRQRSNHLAIYTSQRGNRNL